MAKKLVLEDIKNGDKLVIYNKEVTVIAKVTPNKVVVQYPGDGDDCGHPTRLCLYKLDELTAPEPELTTVFVLSIYDNEGKIGEFESDTYFADDKIKTLMSMGKANRSQVRKIYRLI